MKTLYKVFYDGTDNYFYNRQTATEYANKHNAFLIECIKVSEAEAKHLSDVTVAG